MGGGKKKDRGVAYRRQEEDRRLGLREGGR